MEIVGKTVIITGGGRGIGRAIAEELARIGARVVISARSADQLDQTASDIRACGGEVLAVEADVTSASDTSSLTARALDAFGSIDILINNAGAFKAVGPVWETDIDCWWSDITTNVLGPMHCCQAVLPHMIQSGAGIIINMCGGGADRPFLGASGYGTSKAALMRFTDTLAFELEHAGHPVQVYGFDPGLVRSEMTLKVTQDPAAGVWIPGMREWLDKGMDHPAHESAEAIARLISISCPAITGRLFTYRQDFTEIARRAEEIRARDTYQIRYLTHM